MPGFVDQLPALLGVVVGAAGSYLATSQTEKARWKRQHSTRWDEERRKAYAEYAHALKNVASISSRLAKMRGYVDGRFEDVDIDTGLVELARLTAERAAKWESVLLLGSRETIDAGREWNTIIFDLSDFASGNRRTTPAEWDECYRAAGAARDRFYECARKDLEV